MIVSCVELLKVTMSILGWRYDEKLSDDNRKVTFVKKKEFLEDDELYEEKTFGTWYDVKDFVFETEREKSNKNSNKNK